MSLDVSAQQGLALSGIAEASMVHSYRASWAFSTVPPLERVQYRPFQHGPRKCQPISSRLIRTTWWQSATKASSMTPETLSLSTSKHLAF